MPGLSRDALGNPVRLVVIGGSDAGISAAIRAREVDRTAQVRVIVADSFPNFSICGLPFYLSGEVPDSHSLAHRTRDQIQAHGIELRLEETAVEIDAEKQLVTQSREGQLNRYGYDRILIATGAVPVKPAIAGREPRFSSPRPMYRNGLLLQKSVFAFQFANARLEPLDLDCNIFSRKLPWNMLTAVDVPYVDLDDNRPLDARGVRRIGQATKEAGIAFDDRRAAPHHDPRAVLRVDEKQTHRRVFRQPPHGDVLTVPRKIGESQRGWVQYFEKALRSAAVLNVGLSVVGGSCNEEAVDPGEKCTQPLIDGLRKCSRPLSSRLKSPGAEPLLCGACGGRKHQRGRVVGHGRWSLYR